MKIVHLSTTSNEGGAGRAAYRLHKGLRKLGLDSKMVVCQARDSDEKVLTFAPTLQSTNLAFRFRRYLERHVKVIRDALRLPRLRSQTAPLPHDDSLQPSAYELFWGGRCCGTDELIRFLPDADIVNLHWVSQFLDLPKFFHTIGGKLPIVWTLHDMNAFTGGCHYDIGCRKYLDGCGKCPQLGSNLRDDPSRLAWLLKQKIYSSVPSHALHIVTPSTWLGRLAAQSPLLSRFAVSVIHNGVDTEAFAPRDKAFSRSILGIPTEDPVILFLADTLRNKRKGYTLLSQAIRDLKEERPLLWILNVGKASERIQFTRRFISLGEVFNERLLSLAYSASDVFVIPSLQDNLPNVMLESLACGTPVVGFKVGGIPDAIKPGRTGLLVPVGDTGALKEAVASLLDDASPRRKMADTCRQVAIQEFNLTVQGAKYAKLYETLCEAFRCTR